MSIGLPGGELLVPLKGAGTVSTGPPPLRHHYHVIDLHRAVLMRKACRVDVRHAVGRLNTKKYETRREQYLAGTSCKTRSDISGSTRDLLRDEAALAAPPTTPYSVCYPHGPHVFMASSAALGLQDCRNGSKVALLYPLIGVKKPDANNSKQGSTGGSDSVGESCTGCAQVSVCTPYTFSTRLSKPDS